MVKQIFKTEDGKVFNTMEEAVLHEESQLTNLEKLLKKYQGNYSHEKLLESHNLDEFGVWEVRGEDSNPDFGGHHLTPYIGTVEGKLKNVIEWAVQQQRFFAWGSGGEIRKITMIEV